MTKKVTLTGMVGGPGPQPTPGGSFRENSAFIDAVSSVAFSAADSLTLTKPDDQSPGVCAAVSRHPALTDMVVEATHDNALCWDISSAHLWQSQRRLVVR
jgi:hypothetical protein